MREGGTRCFNCDARIARIELRSSTWRDEFGDPKCSDGRRHEPGLPGVDGGLPLAGVDYVVVAGGRYRCLWCQSMNLIAVATTELVRLSYERHSCGVSQPETIANPELLEGEER